MTEKEKATVREAVRIMKRVCRESELCDRCPAADVFCTGNRKTIPMMWKVPFRRKAHIIRKHKQLTREDFNEIRRNDLLKGKEGRKVEQWLTATGARSAKST